MKLSQKKEKEEFDFYYNEKFRSRLSPHTLTASPKMEPVEKAMYFPKEYKVTIKKAPES